MDFSGHSQNLTHIGARPDVIVECGGSSWDAHGAILTSRCRFFKALLDLENGNEIRKVFIEGLDEYMVEYLLEYIYTGDYDWRKIQGNLTLTEAYMDAFDAADYFLLPDLCKLSEAAFIEMLQTILPAFQYNRRPDATHLFEVVKQVYAWKDTPAGKAFRPIVAGAMHSVQRGLNPAVFIDLIEEIPQLAVDILKFTIQRRE
ncbi:hypothetical protein F5Y10DRAFT_290377 [Nemania abortiva]|nr:hypothetical protein F5Y10DRAFT_290377 [Nemania abortiva]